MNGSDRLRVSFPGLVLLTCLTCVRAHGETAPAVRLSVPEDLYASVEVLADAFGEEAKVKVEITSYSRPAEEFTRLSSEPSGDVLIVPDDAALAEARRLGIVENAGEEPLLYRRLSLGVRKGNPQMIFELSDLAREGMRGRNRCTERQLSGTSYEGGDNSRGPLRCDPRERDCPSCQGLRPGSSVAR